jgi:hypothetical protein
VLYRQDETLLGKLLGRSPVLLFATVISGYLVGLDLEGLRLSVGEAERNHRPTVIKNAQALGFGLAEST